jgi:L-aspartate oxidase
VLRDAESLAATEQVVLELADTSQTPVADPATCELANLVEVAHALLTAAVLRTESRGAHTRADFPDTDPTQRHRIVLAGERRAPVVVAGLRAADSRDGSVRP